VSGQPIFQSWIVGHPRFRFGVGGYRSVNFARRARHERLAPNPTRFMVWCYLFEYMAKERIRRPKERR